MRETIICSAVYVNDKNEHVHQPKNISIGYVVAGRRHHNCFATLQMISPDFSWKRFENIQGFLTNEDRFVDRKEAFKIARCSTQIKNLGEWDKDSCLCSEDIY